MRGSVVRLSQLLLLVVLACSAGFWAGSYFYSDPGEVAVVEPEAVTATAYQGALGEAYPVPVNVEWTEDLALPYVGPSGVVTNVGTDPEMYANFGPGDVIASIDGLPIIVADGEYPAYRTMALGASGRDVEQLQYLLVADGILDANAVDGEFGRSTAIAVETWWATLGIDDQEVVPLGSIVFVANLPRLLAVDSSLQVGGLIATGAPFIVGFDPTPVATVLLTPIQEKRFLSEGASFTIVSDDAAPIEMIIVGSRLRDLATEILLEFDPNQTGEIPAAVSSSIRVTRLKGVMTIAPLVEGTIVPIAAVEGLVTNDPTIRLADGGIVHVDVIAVVGGEAVVDPLEPGAVIVVSR